MSVKNTIPETSCTVIPMGYCMPLYLINYVSKSCILLSGMMVKTIGPLWNSIDCEPSLYFAIPGPGMADSSVWPSGVMLVGEWGESRNDSPVASPFGFIAHFSLIYWSE